MSAAGRGPLQLFNASAMDSRSLPGRGLLRPGHGKSSNKNLERTWGLRHCGRGWRTVALAAAKRRSTRSGDDVYYPQQSCYPGLAVVMSYRLWEASSVRCLWEVSEVPVAIQKTAPEGLSISFNALSHCTKRLVELIHGPSPNVLVALLERGVVGLRLVGQAHVHALV